MQAGEAGEAAQDIKDCSRAAGQCQAVSVVRSREVGWLCAATQAWYQTIT